MSDLFSQLKLALPDRYELERLLGSGGMATVYLARDHQQGRRVAIKLLRPELAGALGLDRFLREIRIASELTHPHILPLLDSGTVTLNGDSIPYYVMPYIEDESLRDRLTREKQLPIEDTIAIARDVAAALAHAHKHGFIHRDIKPENVLLAGHEAVVADFGIARAIDRSADPEAVTTSGIAIGTPAYMSPEQASAQAELDGRTDIYSLGCVVYEMLGGDPPFSGSSANAIAARHRVDQVPPLRTIRPSVSQGLEAAVLRALEKVPADRFASAEQFAAALTDYNAPPATISTTIHGGRRRLPWLRPVLLLALMAGVGWGATHWRRSKQPASSPDVTRLAVTYLEDQTPTHTLQEVANGLTEDLTDALGSVPALHVISSEAMKPFRRTNVGPDSIARALNVGTIVSGSLDTSEGMLRVRVRLIDAATRQQLQTIPLARPWSERLALREEIVSEVDRLLRERLGMEIKLRQYGAETRNLAAWDFMQRGERIWDDARSSEDPRTVETAFLRADSMFALAEHSDDKWAAPIISRGWLNLALSRMQGTDVIGWLGQGLGEAGRALGLKPDDPRALELRGVLRYELSGRGPASGMDSLTRMAEEDLRNAVERDPQRAQAWFTLSAIFRYRGSFEDADWAAQEALKADAYLSNASEVISNLLFSAINRQKFDQAESWCRMGQTRFPHSPQFTECKLIVLAWSGRKPTQVAEAWSEVARIRSVADSPGVRDRWPNHHLMVAMILARAGMGDSARAVVTGVNRRLVGDSARADIGYDEAYVWLLLNERSQALASLARYVRSHPQDRAYVAESPWFRSIQGDPGFQTLTKP
jgi:eukaryotic-like serine/threonine-protein kinase